MPSWRFRWSGYVNGVWENGFVYAPGYSSTDAARAAKDAGFNHCSCGERAGWTNKVKFRAY